MKKVNDKKLFYYYSEEEKFKREEEVQKFVHTHYGLNLYRQEDAR